MHSKRMHSRYTQREHGRRKRDDASMHSASTKHGPAHPRDVDDVDERMPHDRANTAQVHHTPSTKAHSSSTHRMGARSGHGLEHAHVDDKLHGSPCTQYGHAGVCSAGTQSEDPKCAHSESTQGARRGLMHAHGACLPCGVPPVCTWGRGNAAAHRLGATGKRTRPVGTPPPLARRKRGACPAAAKRARPGPPHRTPPPPTMGASETPPQFRRAAQRARSGPPSVPPRSWPSHARAREAPAPAAAAHPQRPRVPHFPL